ncbi:MAG: DNA-3-methyladenine glycosylase [Actinomycetota bacterium]
MKALALPFFARDPLLVAPDLLGRTLYRDSAEGLVSGRIVEVEAYKGKDDPGSHAYRRRTPRNEAMFGPAGRLYVYFTYGMHFCSNVVTGQDGEASAVLLRAVEPLEGSELMAHRRGTESARLLARGPARLCQAFAIGRSENGADITKGDIWIGVPRRIDGAIKTSKRIGMADEINRPWRFYEEGPWRSGPSTPGANS